MSKIKSRPASREYRDNYDRLFRAAKEARKDRATARQVIEELENEAQAQGVPTRRGLR